MPTITDMYTVLAHEDDSLKHRIMPFVLSIHSKSVTPIIN